jgi:hypothetical protein
MKVIKVILILFLIISCRDRNTKSKEIQKILPIENITDSSISLQKENSNNIISDCNIDTILKRFSNYQDSDICIIYNAEKEITNCISAFKENEKDSLYIIFQKLFYNARNKFNASLESKYSSVLTKIMNEENDSVVIEFNQLLEHNGLILQMTEGSYFVDAQSSYFYNLFKGKISRGLDDYLRIRSVEIATQFSEDAMLLISYEELYNRVVTWEDFMTNNKDFFLKKNVKVFYNHYFSTLLTGMDNTPAFGGEDGILNPELRNLYEKIIQKNDSSESTRIILNYYNLLKANQFKQPKNLNEFLEQHGLYSMKAVQPILR